MSSTRRTAISRRFARLSSLRHRPRATRPRFGDRFRATREHKRNHRAKARRDTRLYIASLPWPQKFSVGLPYAVYRLGPGIWPWVVFGVFVLVMSVWALGIDIDALHNECAKYGSCAGGEE
jgi:hypothetical protein